MASRVGERALSAIARDKDKDKETSDGRDQPNPPVLSAPDDKARREEDEKLLRLRQELIVQYMYLLTAPVLAIVSYYLLSMVEARLAESLPIVVLMAFASGLLSEAVLGTISEKAQQYMARLKSERPVRPERPPRTKAK